MRVAVVLTVLSMLRVALKKTFLHLGVAPVTCGRARVSSLAQRVHRTRDVLWCVACGSLEDECAGPTQAGPDTPV